ncbi:hypothetical protein ACFSUS_06680 [Spirosoma soli]|uniref:Uncharacterized protein n=1 Tax=Spirosoma soli TaxID=1770529 RepID=A0ABW5LZY5_9BACT
MLLLFLKAFDKYKDVREFSCGLNDIESALDFLSKLTTKGETLIDACIIEDDSRLDLPVNAFDGELFKGPLKQLESQWQQLLKKPIADTPVDKEAVKGYIQRSIVLNRTQINYVTALLDQLEEKIRTTQAGKLCSATKEMLITLYNAQINKHQNYLAKQESYYQRKCAKLHQLNQV